MENQPLLPPISQKIHFWPHLSFRHFNYINPTIGHIRSHGDSASNASSAVEPVPPAFVVRAPGENRKASSITEVLVSHVVNAAIFPFKRVKLLMQNQNAIIESGRLLKPYNGICNCFASTIRNEGLFSLWRGNIALTIGSVSSKVLFLKTLQHAETRKDESSPGDKLAFVGGLLASQLLNYPFLYASTRMATDVKTSSSIMSNRQFHGTFDVFRKTLKSDGIAGPYRGVNIFFVEMCMILAISIGLKPLERHYSRHFQNNDWAKRTVELGFLIFPSMVCYPLDTVNKRMMMSSCGGDVKYKSSVHAIAHIWRSEGVKSFYSGASAGILVAASYKATLLLLVNLVAGIGASTYSFRWKGA
ncbi:ADP/ATP carrier 2 [Hibiscus trionum]|uniref:ADP/ATP translocase n=1 Tax=Hibiscus trionum TaxID=183268 RepID=A0A9W7M7U2_HIBTR|nr:ADP/ATP carrier 2 [Hibiscus trionum]